MKREQKDRNGEYLKCFVACGCRTWDANLRFVWKERIERWVCV